MRSVEDSVLRIVGDHLGIPSAKLSLECHIVDDLGADSLDHLELMMTFEEVFGIKIPRRDLERAEKIADVVSVIDKVLSHRRRIGSKKTGIADELAKEAEV